MPYYVRPTVWNRWGPDAWLSRIMGLPLPGDEGERYFPGGYRVRDVGPDKGMEGWERERERVFGMGKGGGASSGDVKTG